MAPWPVPVPLLPDELLSSWLVRSALAHGCDPLVLTGVLWPGWRVWTLDPDRGLEGERLDRLVMASRQPEARLREAFLLGVAAAVVGGDPAGRATWPWVLAQGSRGRRRRGGLQACPQCLRGDRHPYFRRRWRLAWHTGCPEHGAALIDGCPACGTHLEPHRVEAMGGALHRCASCGADLRESAQEAWLRGAADFQAAADEVVRDGSGRYGDVRLPASAWFGLSRHLTKLLRRAAMGQSCALSRWLEAQGVDLVAVLPPATGLALELLPVAERAGLLAGVSTVLRAGPEAGRSAAQDLRLSAATLRLDGAALPGVWATVTRGLPDPLVLRRRTGDTPRGPRSEAAVRRKLARLRRRLR